MIPNDRKYTREHDWILIENGIAKLGITDHAQKELGDIVYVELPEVDDEFAIGDTYTTVESVKAASPYVPPLQAVLSRSTQLLMMSPSSSTKLPTSSSSLLSR